MIYQSNRSSVFDSGSTVERFTLIDFQNYRHPLLNLFLSLQMGHYTNIIENMHCANAKDGNNKIPYFYLITETT